MINQLNLYKDEVVIASTHNVISLYDDNSPEFAIGLVNMIDTFGYLKLQEIEGSYLYAARLMGTYWSWQMHSQKKPVEYFDISF